MHEQDRALFAGRPQQAAFCQRNRRTSPFWVQCSRPTIDPLLMRLLPGFRGCFLLAGPARRNTVHWLASMCTATASPMANCSSGCVCTRSTVPSSKRHMILDDAAEEGARRGLSRAWSTRSAAPCGLQANVLRPDGDLDSLGPRSARQAGPLRSSSPTASAAGRGAPSTVSTVAGTRLTRPMKSATTRLAGRA